MTGTITSQNVDFSSWDNLYVVVFLGELLTHR
jgi:hypothetical protein